MNKEKELAKGMKLVLETNTVVKFAYDGKRNKKISETTSRKSYIDNELIEMFIKMVEDEKLHKIIPR